MEIEIKYGEITKSIKNAASIIIGNANADFIVPELLDNEILKLVYTDKYNNYVLINQGRNPEVLCNGRIFSKILVTPEFEITSKSLEKPLKISILNNEKFSATAHAQEQHTISHVQQNNVIQKPKIQEPVMQTSSDNVFDCDTEKNRISIIKEIGFKTNELKQGIKTANNINFILSGAMGVLSVISAFAITNYLLGLKIDTSSSTINLTTNFWFLAGAALIILAVCVTLKYAVSSLVSFNSTARAYGTSDVAQKLIIGVCLCFIFVIYVLNLCYYKPVSGFSALFISLLFVGGLGVVTIGSGYFHGQLKVFKQHLDAYEYREDFESVIKNYRILISKYINKLSPNKINTVKSHLLNHQLWMIVEVIAGIATSPLLAYGVSNTIAACFPEAANWVRISGLRFSPVFLALATVLIIFAFFSFVRAFTIGKQIKGSEIIKYDGFHDYSSHGVTIFGLDSMKNLEREKKIVMFIACSIIFIEFTMNVSYFVTELGGDIRGILLSIIVAFIPTSLLIAETHLLSDTTYKINNLNELLEKLD